MAGFGLEELSRRKYQAADVLSAVKRIDRDTKRCYRESQGGCMNGEVCVPDKSQIARAILAYLRKHPDAQDTLDGILRDWLLEKGSTYKPAMVREVIKDLVLEGTILERTIPGADTIYRLNIAKQNRLKELSKKKDQDS
jgi:hypothetical protein